MIVGATGVPALLQAGSRGLDAADPNRPIRLGMIGIGNMGGGHLSGIVRHPDFRVVAVCDVNKETRDRSAKRVRSTYGADGRGFDPDDLRVVNEYEKVLADPRVEAVLIATPDHWHAAIAIAACIAGKDVYCEKPLSLTVREAIAMEETARRYGVVFQTGSQQRSMANFRHACELVRNGRIGRLKSVRVGIGQPSSPKWWPKQPVPKGLDWERWLGQAPWVDFHAERVSGSYSGGWRLNRDYSGGMTTDWGAHHFDIAQWGMGRDGDGPVEVRPPDKSRGTDLQFIYDDGLIMERGGANGVKFVGSHGTVEVNRGYLKTTPDRLQEEKLGPEDIQLYRSRGHLQDWVDAIRSRQRPICDVAIGASSVIVCHLGNIASWLDRPIRWDPKTRQIIGDELASRWLDRPRRTGYPLFPGGRA